MMSFFHNGSEIKTWMEYSFKAKSTESKAIFLRQTSFFGCQAADHKISTRTPELYADSLKQLFL